MHEDKLANISMLDQIHKRLCTKQKLLQLTYNEHNKNISALKSGENNERVVQDGSPNLHNHYGRWNCKNGDYIIYTMLHLFDIFIGIDVFILKYEFINLTEKFSIES